MEKVCFVQNVLLLTHMQDSAVINARFGTYSLFVYQTGGSNTEQLQIDGIHITEQEQELSPVTWRLPAQEEMPTKECNLIIALAGASRGGTTSRDLPCLTVALNDRILKKAVFVNDGAIYRSATRNGRYRYLKIACDPAVFHKGENVVRLGIEGGMVMYDTILLTETV